MFFEDRARALAEMWRVLAPGGSLAVAVWGPLTDTPGYSAMVDLLRSLFGEEIAAELQAPFSHRAAHSGDRLLWRRPYGTAARGLVPSALLSYIVI